MTDRPRTCKRGHPVAQWGAPGVSCRLCRRGRARLHYLLTHGKRRYQKRYSADTISGYTPPAESVVLRLVGQKYTYLEMSALLGYSVHMLRRRVYALRKTAPGLAVQRYSVRGETTARKKVSDAQILASADKDCASIARAAGVSTQAIWKRRKKLATHIQQRNGG